MYHWGHTRSESWSTGSRYRMWRLRGIQRSNRLLYENAGGLNCLYSKHRTALENNHSTLVILEERGGEAFKGLALVGYWEAQDMALEGVEGWQHLSGAR